MFAAIIRKIKYFLDPSLGYEDIILNSINRNYQRKLEALLGTEVKLK